MIEGKDVIAIPQAYLSEFRKDPVDSLLKYGSLPQRARAPWFTDTAAIDRALVLPDQITGPGAVAPDPKVDHRSLVGSTDDFALLNGINPHFRSGDQGYWHVHVDLALNKKRHGDAAGIAMGRIAESYIEKSKNPLMEAYERVVRSFEVPLVAQIVAPTGGQIYITSIVRLVLQLKQVRGFNITSFSFDGFQSASAMQELALAGLVTHGMEISPETGEVFGLPKPFSVDGGHVQPYRELLEGANEGRVMLPKYELLRKELREMEVVQPGFAPDHGVGGSKDTADPVAGILGYLSAYGHAELAMNEPQIVNREDLERSGTIDPARQFGVEEDEAGLDFNEGLDQGSQLDFSVG